MPKLIYMADLPKYDIHFSATHLGRLINAGKFPTPAKMGDAKSSRRVWLESEILEYRNKIIANRVTA